MSRTDSPPTPPRTARFGARLRALPLGLVLAGALVLLAALFPVDALRDAVTFERVPEAHLVRSPGYVVLAPFTSILDTLSLLSVGQHIALIVTLLLCYALWWWRIGRASLETIPPARRALRELARVGVGFIGLLAIYAVGVLVPRPMARLEKSVDVVSVDFHSHTRYSHDGRSDWTTEKLRTWHRDAGFDIAFVSDHRTFDGAREGWVNNPRIAGEGTVLIPAIEVGWRGEHVNVLDADRLYRGLLTDDLRDIDEKALTLASALPNNEPVIIETIPGNLAHVLTAAGPGTAGIRAIEIVDGSPRGLSQTRRQHDTIVHLADSANIALVAGSDHHGWGYTASAWTLMYMPGWRAATPEQLSVQIGRILRGGGKAATRVVERYVANTEGALLPLTVPLVTWGMMRSLDGDERIVWIAWLTVFYALGRLRAMWRRTTPE